MRIFCSFGSQRLGSIRLTVCLKDKDPVFCERYYPHIQLILYKALGRFVFLIFKRFFEFVYLCLGATAGKTVIFYCASLINMVFLVKVIVLVFSCLCFYFDLLSKKYSMNFVKVKIIRIFVE